MWDLWHLILILDLLTSDKRILPISRRVSEYFYRFVGVVLLASAEWLYLSEGNVMAVTLRSVFQRPCFVQVTLVCS